MYRYCPEHGFLYVSAQGDLRTPQSRATCISEPWDHILDVIPVDSLPAAFW